MDQPNMDQQHPQQQQQRPVGLPAQQQLQQQQQPSPSSYSYVHQPQQPQQQHQQVPQQQLPPTQYGSSNTFTESTMAQVQRQQPHQPSQPLPSSYLPPMQLPAQQQQQQSLPQPQFVFSNHQQTQLMQSMPQRVQGAPRPMDSWPLSSGNKSFPPLSTSSTGSSSSGFPQLPPIRLPTWPPLANVQQPQQSSEYLATPMPSAATTPIVDSSGRNATNPISDLLPLAMTSTTVSTSSSGAFPFAAAQQHQYQQQDSAAMRYYQPYRALLGSPAPAVPLPPTPISASAPMFLHHAQDTAVAGESPPFISSSYTPAPAPSVVPIAGSALASALGHPIASQQQQQQQRAGGYAPMFQVPTVSRADSYSNASGTPSSVIPASTTPALAGLPRPVAHGATNLAHAIMTAPPTTTSGPGLVQAHTYAPYPAYQSTYQSTYQPSAPASTYYAPYQHPFADPNTYQPQPHHPSPPSPASPLTPGTITTFTWDDLSTLVYQIDIDLIPVCRRASDNYVNGTKLLNLTAMSRGKRDSILKHERLRSVVKCGPMRLKGVWIPLGRARELARAVKVDAQVFPLLEADVDEWVARGKVAAATEAGGTAPQEGSLRPVHSVKLEPQLEHESVQFVDMQQDAQHAMSDPVAADVPSATSPHVSPVRPRRVSATATIADALLALASDCWRKPATAAAAIANTPSADAQPRVLEPTEPAVGAVADPQPQVDDDDAEEEEEEQVQAPPAKRPRRSRGRAAPKPKPLSDPQPARKRTTRTSTAAAAAAASTSARVTRARSRQAAGNLNDDDGELTVGADDVEVVTALHLLAGGRAAPATAANADAGTVDHAQEEDEEEDEDEVKSALMTNEREREASPLLPEVVAGVENEQEDVRGDEVGNAKGERGGRGKGKQADIGKKSSASGSGKRKRKGDE